MEEAHAIAVILNPKGEPRSWRRQDERVLRTYQRWDL